MKSCLYTLFVLGFLFFVLSLCFSSSAHAKFYNWVDANGVAHFSQNPPINSNQLEIKTYEEPKYPAGEMLENIPDLHKAAAMGNLEKVKALVANGISVNSLSPGKGNALHFAAGKGQLHVVEWLLENGSILDLKDRHNMTPLLFAAR
ncbi:MAG: ankyrin repeat domain-containing protein [bacterium]